MMTCEKSREVLSAGLDGEADPVQIAETLKHTGSCKGCLDYLKHLADSQATLQAWHIDSLDLPPLKVATPPAVKPFFLTGILQKIKPFPAIAFATAVVLISIFLIREDKIEPTQLATTIAKNQQVIYLDSRVKGMIPR